LARLRLADLFLHTLPYNAHTTASDALWAGLPLLTCPGKSFASRVAASLLHAVELPELVMDSLEAYEAKAIELAKDTSQLNAIKLKLEQNRKTSSLFDGKLFAQHLEMAYEAMFSRYQAGLAPDVIDVGELIQQKG
jgi:predicted O-linked N-acetylglucosamine transferase (SPINDLY family)